MSMWWTSPTAQLHTDRFASMCQRKLRAPALWLCLLLQASTLVNIYMELTGETASVVVTLIHGAERVCLRAPGLLRLETRSCRCLWENIKKLLTQTNNMTTCRRD